jgi:hypothetical protein
VLRAFPFRNFDEIAELGLEVCVYCSSCYREKGPIDLTDARLRGQLFAGTRFVCSSIRRYGSATPPRHRTADHPAAGARPHTARPVDPLVFGSHKPRSR